MRWWTRWRRFVPAALKGWSDVLYRDGYRLEMAQDILDRVAAGARPENTRLLRGGRGRSRHRVHREGRGGALSTSNSALRRSSKRSPGVESDARFLGTFDRAEAVSAEELDFFANGHALVEGLLLELEDGTRGRAAMLDLPRSALPGPGLACVFKDGASWSVRVVGADGEPRPDWGQRFLDATAPRASFAP